MNKERLLVLAKRLGRVTKANFRIAGWAQRTGCGTVACAAGHAGLIKAFQKEGFCTHTHITGGEVAYGTHRNVYACMEFFGLTYDQACYLFYPNYYDNVDVTPGQVKKRIENFVFEQEMEALREPR